MSEHVTRLRKAAEEIRREGHAGWGNTCEEAADEIERLRAMLKKARDAIASAPEDAFGIAPETHDCPAYPIRDALVHDITKELGSETTPGRDCDHENGYCRLNDKELLLDSERLSTKDTQS